MARGGARHGAGRKPAPHKSLNIRLPLSMAEAVEKAASKEGITTSAWVRRAIEVGVSKEGEKMLSRESKTDRVKKELDAVHPEFFETVKEYQNFIWGRIKEENDNFMTERFVRAMAKRHYEAYH